MHRAVIATAYDVMPLQVWTARPDGTLDYVNPGVVGYFCVAPERILEHGWKDLCHPLDLTHAMERWKHALDTGEPYEIAFRLLRGIDRQYRWHVSRAVPVRDAGGTISHWVGTNTEIDWLKRAEEVGLATLSRTQREHERWQALFAQMPVAVIVTAGPALCVELCSDAARALTAEVELVGRPLGDAFPALVARFAPGQLDAVYAGQSGMAAPQDIRCCPLRRASGEIDGLIVLSA